MGAIAYGAAMLIPLVGFVSTSSGQDQGPVTITTRRDYEGLVISDIAAALRLEYRLDIDDLDRADGTDQRSTEQEIREILELDFGGFVGHPNLVTFDLSGEVWLTQTDIDVDPGQDNEFDNTLLDYNAVATFFQESDLPITLYAIQSINDLNRQFGGPLTNTVTEYGVRLDVRDEAYPTRIEAFRREQVQDDSLDNTDFRIEQYTLHADGRSATDEAQKLWWDVTYDMVDESGNLGPQDFDRLQANVRHTVDFGAENEHQARTSAGVFQEQGDRDYTRYRLSERLRFRHSEDLISRIEYTGQLIERPSFEQQRHDLTGQVEHQLFESLLTIARAGYRRQDVPTDNYDSDEIFGEVTLDYTKQVPYGTFFAGLDLNLSHLDESSRGSTIGVVGQLLVFDANGTITINRRNVEPTSIVVRDSTGLITYSEGTDYLVVSFPTSTEIRRILGGNISAGQAVLVDYDIGPEPGGETDTLGLGLEFRYTLDEGFLRGLSVYTRLFDQDEERSRTFLDGDEFPENDFTSLVYGAEYTRGRVYGKIEYEDRDSNFDPFTAWRVEGRYMHRLDARSNIVINALFQSLDRTEVDVTSETLTLSARWNHQFTDRLSGSALVLWQDEQTSFGGDAEGFEQELRLRWRRGRTDLVARFRNSIRDTEVEDTMFQTLFVGIRREF